MGGTQDSRGLDRWPKRFLKIAAVGMVAVAIFGFGFGVGNGSITFGTVNDTPANLPEDLNYSSVEKVYDTLKANYDGKLDATKLLDGIKHGLATATGDPYTEYFTADEARNFTSSLNGSFSGVGIELGKDADGNLTVVAPIDGSPASRAGLRAKDIIVSIDSTPTNGMSIDEAVSRIRGKKDTKVTLRIVRGGQDLSFTITREDIKIPSVKSETLDGNIGYLKISQFGDDTSELVRAAAQGFADKHVKGIVLDLRGNPGGLLDSAVDISSLWVQQGKTLLQEKQDGVITQTYEAKGGDILRGIPTVVLIDEGSASASEITAGALRDNNVATVVGVKSYGKGVVQGIFPLDKGAEIKITVARWYRPNGENIDKKGITPDKVVKMTEDDYKNNRDPQKDAALEILRK